MTTYPGFIALAITALVACAGAPRPPASAAAPTATAAAAPAAPGRHERPRAPDPDLHRPPPRRLLDIAWAQVDLTDDAAALALWRRIAPTGADWEDKLQEIPAAAARPLAIAVLRGGNFLCTPPPRGECRRPIYDVDPPADAAGFDDPCLRRLLALWSIDQLDDDDRPRVEEALRAIAALPPPESELVAAAIRAVPKDDQDARLALLAGAWRAGQRDLVAAGLGGLDEAHLFAAVRRHHIDSALDILSAEGHRAVYLAAVTDETLGTQARTAAIGDLAALPTAGDQLAPDLAAALAAAVRSKDCGVAAAAARALDQHGDHRFVPRRPRTANVAQVMRALCVLASYEGLLHNDEASLVPSYVPARGLARMTITYDALSDDDSDGDGDPHTTHTAELVAQGEAVLPELEDLVRAMRHCTGTICVSDDREFRFVWTRSGSIDAGPRRTKDRSPLAGAPADKQRGGELWLSRIELAERPPCTQNQAPPP